MGWLLATLRHVLKLTTAPMRWLWRYGIEVPHGPVLLLISLSTVFAGFLAAVAAASTGNGCCIGNFGDVVQAKADAKADLD